MYFAIVCLLVFALLATGVKPDDYGWMMLVGTGWVAGYLDARKFSTADKPQLPGGPDDFKDADTFNR